MGVHHNWEAKASRNCMFLFPRMFFSLGKYVEHFSLHSILFLRAQTPNGLRTGGFFRKKSLEASGIKPRTPHSPDKRATTVPAPRSFKVAIWSLFFSAINRMTVQLKSVQMSSSDQSTDQMSDPSSGGDSPEGPEDGPAQFLFGERFESSANILLEWKPLLRAFKVWNYFCLCLGPRCL